MPVLKLWQQGSCRQIPFSGTPVLSVLLQQQGIPADHPCGGRGSCGKCAIRAEGALSELTPEEKAAGTRLSCRTRLLGDAAVWLRRDTDLVEVSGDAPVPGNPMPGRIGGAVDIGTTTLALKLYDLAAGTELAWAGAPNPQRTVAADVMGRIDAAMKGSLPLLQTLVKEALRELLAEACRKAALAPEEVDVLVVTGNTTMLYLLTGRDPSCLSRAPFQADCLFDREDTLWDIPVYYPPCISSFVGADIACALLSSGIALTRDTGLLCDIGTNGELALWKAGNLFVTSTAAGPAFEGAGISCGCGSIPGAIDRVWLEKGSLRIHTIDDQPPVGLCGSGLVDAVAAFLETGAIDETGALEGENLPLTEQLFLLPGDIRAVQLAKGAVAAGIRTLMEQAEVTDTDCLYIAGGFGTHLNVASARTVGLIPPELGGRVRVLGNAALSGAAALLLDRDRMAAVRELARRAVTVTLSGSRRFNDYFMEAMLFGSEEDAE